MSDIQPLYDSVIENVLSSLRAAWRETSHWDEFEIDEKIDRLKAEWLRILQQKTAEEEEKEGQEQQQRRTPLPPPSVSAESSTLKRVRPSKDDDVPADKRFRSGPQLSSLPLSYPTLRTSTPQPADTDDKVPVPVYMPQYAATNRRENGTGNTANNRYINVYENPLATRTTATSPSPSSQPIPPSLPPRSRLPTLAAPSSLSALAQQAEPDDDDESDPRTHAHLYPDLQTLAQYADNADTITTKMETAESTTTTDGAFSSSTSQPLATSTTLSAANLSLLNEPLSVADDDSDLDLDLSSVKDVCVCQYDKVKHAKNKWQVVLSHGILKHRGREYVFSKLTGEMSW